MERECSEDGKQGVGKFAYKDLSPELASKRHVLEGAVTAIQASWSLTFFGTAKWSYSRKLKPLRPPPDPGYHFTITNPFDDLTVDSSYDIVPAS